MVVALAKESFECLRIISNGNRAQEVTPVCTHIYKVYKAYKQNCKFDSQPEQKRLSTSNIIKQLLPFISPVSRIETLQEITLKYPEYQIIVRWILQSSNVLFIVSLDGDGCFGLRLVASGCTEI